MSPDAARIDSLSCTRCLAHRARLALGFADSFEFRRRSARVAGVAGHRRKVVVANVAVWATQKCANSKAKTSTDQSVDPVDRRHDFASKLSAANVAYPQPCDRGITTLLSISTLPLPIRLLHGAPQELLQ